MGELRESIAEELKSQPKHRKLAFALLSSFRTAALRHLGESWEPIIMEASRQFLKIIKIIEIAEGREIEGLEDALSVAVEYGLIGGFELDEDSVTLEGVLESLGWDERTCRGKAACIVTKGIVLEGLRREGLDVVELEEDLDGDRATFRWRTR
ncbi:hypothetical protein [Methanopyrus kandleri]|nr:hypothetical protein [Methanopyrus kandleri]